VIVDLNGDNLLDLLFTTTKSILSPRGFVTRFDSSGAVDFSTFLGAGTDAFGVAIDNANTIYVVGATSDDNFPTVDPLQPDRVPGSSDAYLVRIASEEFDFGDAPDSYGTSIAVAGVWHRGTGVQLGALRDVESNAALPLNGAGDDAGGADDEDGVAFTLLAVDGRAQVTATLAQSGGSRLYGWIDFNGDGDFADAGEQIADGTGQFAGLGNGSVVISFAVPDVDYSGPTFARFRVSTEAGLGSHGGASDGEVEDYAVDILPRSPLLNIALRGDVEGDVDVDIVDIIALIRELRTSGTYTLPFPPFPSPTPPPYLDVDGNYQFNLLDIVEVIKILRALSAAEGEPGNSSLLASRIGAPGPLVSPSEPVAPVMQPPPPSTADPLPTSAIAAVQPLSATGDRGRSSSEAFLRRSAMPLREVDAVFAEGWEWRARGRRRDAAEVAHAPDSAASPIWESLTDAAIAGLLDEVILRADPDF
jgi:hypothetical protein